MRRLLSLAGLLLLGWACSTPVRAQAPPTVENDFRNSLLFVQRTPTIGLTYTTAPATVNTNTNITPGTSGPFHMAVNLGSTINDTARLVLQGGGLQAGDVVQMDITWTQAQNAALVVSTSTNAILLNVPAPGYPAGTQRIESFRYNGASNWTRLAWPPRAADLNNSTAEQFRNATAFGGFVSRGLGSTAVSGTTTSLGATSLTYSQSANFAPTVPTSVRLQSAIVGRPIVTFGVSYNYGDEIPRPSLTENGTGLPDTYYEFEPLHSLITSTVTTIVTSNGISTTTGPIYAAAAPDAVPGSVFPATSTLANGDKKTVIISCVYGDVTKGPDPFYYSPHAKKVFATQPGKIQIKWREKSPSTVVRVVDYYISSSPAKTPRKLYWTENGFNGPRVQFAGTRIKVVNIVYNSLFPSFVSEAASYRQPNQDIRLLPETRTAWYDASQNIISAYNKEGRIFVEYLGNSKDDNSGTREHLGVEIVEVVKEITPVRKVVNIGDQVPPPQEGEKAAVAAGNGLNGKTFLHEQISQGGTTRRLYAIRETVPQALDISLSGEVLIYWEEPDALQVYWPAVYQGYVFQWPSALSAYSVYARSNQNLLDSAATGVQLDSTNTPTLVYQDDVESKRAVLTPQNVFYSNVSTDNPVNRTLIRYTSGDDIWFERVYSVLNTTLPGANGTYTGSVTGTFNLGALNLNDLGVNTGSGTLVLINPLTGAIIPTTDYVVTNNVITAASGKTLPATVVVNVTNGKAMVDVGTRILPAKVTLTSTYNATDQTFATGYTDITDVVVRDPAGTVMVEGTDYALDAVEGVLTRKDARPTWTQAVITFRPIAIGYIRENPLGRSYNPEAYVNPFQVGFAGAANSCIIGVNALPGKDKLEVWWYTRSHPPAGSKVTPTYWPSSVQTYQLQWPATPPEIILASNNGSGALPSLQAKGKIYYQNDKTQAGYNPNEEHALMANGRAWALRDDLNVADSSGRYVLVSYTEADAKPAMAVFKVLREKSPVVFNYTAVAGVPLQAPMPLPLLPAPLKANGAVASYEVGASVDLPKGVINLDGADANFAHYKGFTWTDRKGGIWVYRGPHDTFTTAPTFTMRYFYKTQAGFYYPGLTTQPPVGTITPYLRAPDGTSPDGYLASAVTGVGGTGSTLKALDVVFTPSWPKNAPELRIGQTLTVPTLGLPAVRGQSSAEIIYQQSIARDDSANKSTMAQRQKSAALFDPTVKKGFALDKLGSTARLSKIPSSVKTSSYLGKIYFPNLPPHLSQRFYFDPNEGPYGTISLKGDFINVGTGEPYLLPNILSKGDLAAVKGLCPATTIEPAQTEKAQWDAAITGLGVLMNTFIEDPAKPGTYIIDTSETKYPRYQIVDGLRRLIPTGISPSPVPQGVLAADPGSAPVATTLGSVPLASSSLAEVFSSDTAVDSYAVATNGGGTGFVVMAMGNGRAFTPPDEPVSLQVFKVTAPLNRGELKVINSANPLDEKLTLQHSGDFAGHPEDYDFEWRYAPPVDGLPPELYTYSGQSLLGTGTALGNSSFELTRNPGADFAGLRSLDAVVAPLTTVTILNGGRGYITAPTVTIAGPGLATAVITNGVVTAVNIINGGSNYFTGVFLTFSAPPPGGVTASAIATSSSQTTTVNGSTRVINDGLGATSQGTDLPNLILRRRFVPAAGQVRPAKLYVSLDLGDHVGAAVYLNNVEAAVWKVPNRTDSSQAVVPAATPTISPLPLVFEVDAKALLNTTNVVTVELYTDAIAGTASAVNFRMDEIQQTENLTSWTPVDLVGDETKSAESPAGLLAVAGKNRHTIQGSSLLTLTDNWFITRYRARRQNTATPPADITPANAAYVADGGWSTWTNPMLAEGWIKRALGGINPFQQRLRDLFNNAVNTDVSLVQQAGKRWEGDIPLSLANINNFGLIEIYETILRRGKTLSIEGTPAIGYDGANDALLLAAGYLNDLYMVLGNEAYADAANPTIAFGTDNANNFSSIYGDVATSLFAFKGQVSSVLEEELALLRGRDDFLQPGTRTAPVYNRLPWNYTRGIDAGEAVYALNYNIKDVAWDYFLQPSNPSGLGFDGIISAADAATLFPQGHGDAYGHYLTALTNYYSLLHNSHFSWSPRIEAVLVLGLPVSVDYLDERKFAAAAAAEARTAHEIVSLTYRQAFSAASENSWTQLKDSALPNTRTGLTRAWGLDEWASRAGQGAYYNWVTGNSLLPAVDPDPSHTGIQKIDRTTVPELAEITAEATAIQQSLDDADAHLNPLGVAAGALAFDISPSEVDAGKTHYEQIAERANTALQNAANAFSNAKGSTQFLRQQEDSSAAQRAVIEEQEQAFTNQLIEVYGTPYPDDVGPGKTYQQGYAGPDLLHYLYVDITEDFTKGQFTPTNDDYTMTMHLKLEPNAVQNANLDLGNFDTSGGTPAPGLNTDPDNLVAFTLDKIRGEFRKPATWGSRVSPGSIQTAVSNFLQARQSLASAASGYDLDSQELLKEIQLYQTALQGHLNIRKRTKDDAIAQATLDATKFAASTAQHILQTTEEINDRSFAAIVSGLPSVVGTATDPSFAGRLALALGETAAWGVSEVVDIGLSATQEGIDVVEASLDRFLAIDVDDENWKVENAQLIYDLRKSLVHIYADDTVAFDAANRQFNQAQRDLAAAIADGDRVQQQRLVFRQRAAAVIQGFRTRDFAFRSFRDEALEKYKTLFDLASRYTYLAARAYDYETGLLDLAGNSAAAKFYERIVQARALGVILDGQPQFAGSSKGDPGLSGVLAQLSSDWSVVKNRLGFNNPSNYSTTFSLRQEKYRILPGTEGDSRWHDVLASAKIGNLLDDQDVKRYCLQGGGTDDLSGPGFVIPFQTTITSGYNFFGVPLAGGDHTFTPTSFATKIRSSGIALAGYVGMEETTTTSATLSDIGATSPAPPSTAFANERALSATPYIYLIPVGVDSMRAPALGDRGSVRTWQVADQAIPLPFNIAGSDYSTNPAWVSAASLTEAPFAIRKHQAFRAVPEGADFTGNVGFTNARLIGRSVWNSQWKIVIPGNTLLNDPRKAVEIFSDTVKDIKLHLETYSYSGN